MAAVKANGEGGGSGDFMLEKEGSPGLFAVFSQDEGAGYFFTYRPDTREVLSQVQVYENSASQIHEKDIQVMWSNDHERCGVVVRGRMRAVINVTSGREILARMNSRHGSAVSAPEWLKGFNDYLDQEQFIRARQRFWKAEVRHHEPGARPLPENETPIQTNFIVCERGPDDLFAVFEDDGSSGYLYLYDSKKGEIAEYLHNYDRSEQLVVQRENVGVTWSDDGRKCGVIIWDKMRGIIDRQKSLPGRVWMKGPDSPGIADEEWLQGFEHLRS